MNENDKSVSRSISRSLSRERMMRKPNNTIRLTKVAFKDASGGTGGVFN
jgi:hypothetical protein